MRKDKLRLGHEARLSVGLAGCYRRPVWAGLFFLYLFFWGLVISVQAYTPPTWGVWQSVPDGKLNGIRISFRESATKSPGGVHQFYYRFFNGYAQTINFRIELTYDDPTAKTGKGTSHEDVTIKPGETRQYGGFFLYCSRVTGFRITKLEDANAKPAPPAEKPKKPAALPEMEFPAPRQAGESEEAYRKRVQEFLKTHPGDKDPGQLPDAKFDPAQIQNSSKSDLQKLKQGDVQRRQEEAKRNLAGTQKPVTAALYSNDKPSAPSTSRSTVTDGVGAEKKRQAFQALVDAVNEGGLLERRNYRSLYKASMIDGAIVITGVWQITYSSGTSTYACKYTMVPSEIAIDSIHDGGGGEIVAFLMKEGKTMSEERTETDSSSGKKEEFTTMVGRNQIGCRAESGRKISEALVRAAKAAQGIN